MGIVKDLCVEMSTIPQIMTFSDIANALAKGAAVGQKVHDPVTGAVLNLSIEAGKRATSLAQELLDDLKKPTATKIKP